jgi:hypothetical protein
MATFVNRLYRPEWARESTLRGAGGCAQETYFPAADGGYAVCDGACSLIGYVSESGVFTCDGELTQYKAGFLRGAGKELWRLGSVGDMAGDEV